MPHKKGRGTYKGYESPNTHGWPEPIREEVRLVYGAWREKNPGEDPKIKARGSRIAWSTAKKKYPKLYAQHVRGTKKEQKEHPWAGKKTAERIAEDHIKEDPSAYISDAKNTLHPIQKITPASTQSGRNQQISDLKATATEQRRWSKDAEKEGKEEEGMAKKAIRSGHPVKAHDLKQDAKLAQDFSKFRKKKAEDYDLQAARIAAVTGE